MKVKWFKQNKMLKLKNLNSSVQYLSGNMFKNEASQYILCVPDFFTNEMAVNICSVV